MRYFLRKTQKRRAILLQLLGEADPSRRRRPGAARRNNAPDTADRKPSQEISVSSVCAADSNVTSRRQNRNPTGVAERLTNALGKNGKLDAPMRILLLNLTAESLLEANNALAGQGYEVSAEIGLTIDQVLALTPEVLVTEACANDLDCAGLISSLKARPDVKALKIVMIVPGGATDRAHALNLGADDAVTQPPDGTA